MQPGIQKLLMVLLAVLALAAAPEGQRQPLSVLLEEGVYLEETAGKPREAIEVYQQVVDAEAKDRALAAEALYRIGQCQLKLDQKDAALQAFRDLARSFPEQKELTTQANAEIERLGGTVEAAKTPALFPEVVNCQLKYTIPLEVQQGPAMPKQEISLYELSLIDLQWSLPAELEGRVAYWCVGMEEYGHGETELWRVRGLPAEMRSLRYGETIKTLLPKGSQKFEQPVLKPGEYHVYLGAYDSNSSPDDDRPVKPLAWASAKLVIKPLVLSQLMVNDIQADGRMTFRGGVQIPNRTGQVETSFHFINSDFVHVEQMSDNHGRPLQFTTAHTGSHYSYDVKLNEPVPVGGVLMYAMAGTQTGLVRKLDEPGQFKYGFEHWPSAGTSVRRMDLIRLPAGARIVQTAPQDMPRRLRDGRWELLVDQVVAAGGSIYTGIQYDMGPLASQFIDTTTQPAASLKIGPAPWANGERMQLRVLTRAGAEMGTLIYKARRPEERGKPWWRVASHMVVPDSNMFQYTRVDAEAESFSPISGVTKNTALGSFDARYGQKSVSLSTKTDGGAKTREIPLRSTVFDNEQAIHLIRRLPLAEAYSTSFKIFPVQSGTVVDCEINVQGKETVQAPAGTYECFKVELKIKYRDMTALTHHLWFSNDEHKYLVKYDADEAVMELTGVTVQTDEGGPWESRGLRLVLPGGWDIYESARPQLGYKQMVCLLPPQMEAWALLTVASADVAQGLTPRQIAEGDVGVLKGFFENYRVREDSWQELTVGGMPAARYVADYTEKGAAKVEYRTYVLGGQVYWFVFRMEKERFEELRPGLDAVVASFKVESAATAAKE